MGNAEKIVGIMQPYFLPYFEHFRLIFHCDEWVVFDTPQYSRKSWINRNRILNRDKGWSYISVPVQHTGLDTAIKDALIASGEDWRRQVLDRLRIYQKEAPFYAVAKDLMSDVFASEFRTISELNIALLRAICIYLGIDTPILVTSELDVDLPEQCDPGEWALHISKSRGATEYRNPAGGVQLFNEQLYASNGIRLSFHQHVPRTYATGSFKFVSDLSVIDWIMWNDPAVLRDWLK